MVVVGSKNFMDQRFLINHGLWESLEIRGVRGTEIVGSNPTSPISIGNNMGKRTKIGDGLYVEPTFYSRRLKDMAPDYESGTVQVRVLSGILRIYEHFVKQKG